jgi:hypothetical protein
LSQMDEAASPIESSSAPLRENTAVWIGVCVPFAPLALKESKDFDAFALAPPLPQSLPAPRRAW